MFPDYNMNPYYGIYNYRGDYDYRNVSQTNMYSDEIITLNQAIELIRQSVGDEREDELFYDNLIKQAPTEKDKEIIRSIRNDERKHNQILRKLYYDFTGQIITQDISTPSLDANLSYEENLEKALFGELNAVTKYRKIMGTMPSGESYTLLMSIMTDELRHASKYNFLIHNAK
ncbi:MAG: ferritin-like domain-containing protein [Clostridia bacterium]|nr:ferritin-like domain-containing protein [Clostridia bacterium]